MNIQFVGRKWGRTPSIETNTTHSNRSDVFGVLFEFGRYDIAHLVLAALYFILLCYAASILLKLLCGRAALIRWQKSFMIISLCGCIGRVAYFALAIPMRESKLAMPSHVMFVLNSAPAFLFFICYLIVLFVWIELFHTMNKTDLKDPSFKIRTMRPVFMTIVVLIWLTVFILYVLDFTYFDSHPLEVSVSTNLAEMTIIAFVALLYFVTAFAFLVYGTRFYAELRRTGAKVFTVQSRRQRIVLEVQIITMVFTLCFLVRGGLTIWQIFTSEALSAVWFSDLLYFGMLELLPMTMLVVILRPRQALPNYVVASSSFSPLINTTYN